MSGKSLLFAVLAAFLIFGLARTFKTDTSNPNTVLNRYLERWEENNTSGMYRLISQRAKEALRRKKVNNVTDYYAHFVEQNNDLTAFEIVTRQINQDNGRVWVKLKVLNEIGRDVTEEAIFYLVREPEGWRVDGWAQGNTLNLP